MSNTITGKVLSVGQATQMPGKDPSRPFVKRELVIDCTRHDPVTGERSPFENTPMLEFVGDSVHMLDDIQAGDIVTVTIDIVGTKYQDKATRQEKIFTRVRPYKIERRANASQASYQPAQQPAAPYMGQQPTAAPQQAWAPHPGLFPPPPDPERPF